MNQKARQKWLGQFKSYYLLVCLFVLVAASWATLNV